MAITFGDMAESLYRLRQRYGLYYNPSEREIFEEALKTEDGIPPNNKLLGILLNEL